METLAELVRLQLKTREWESGRVGEYVSKPSPNFLPHPLARTMVMDTDYPIVGTATLELAEAPLYEQIRQFAGVAVASGCHAIELIPLFLLPGVHVKEDIPAEVALAQRCLGEAVAIAQHPHIGAHPQLAQLWHSHWANLNAEAKILLSHGSRRAGGNEPVQAMAQQLGAVAAYWSVPPSLEEQITALVDAGEQRIAILPYFLFKGGITDAIAQQINQLRSQFPKVQLNLGEPIGASAKLANLIVNLIQP